MCGICAIAFPGDPPPDAAIGAMTGRLAHRGPDASGTLALPGCRLGHARLSIIDLRTGGQPMVDETGRYAVAYNGEIYNFRELRETLAGMGHVFRTGADTEVLLNGWAAWGEGCLDRFRGMFAFVLRDGLDGTVYAARDPFGEKPLYYATAPSGALVAASEIKALLASGLVTPRIDREAVDAYLALGYVPPDRTIYGNVRVLPPGHLLRLDRGGARVRPYWRPRFDTRPVGLEEAARRLDDLLGEAVARQMVSDVPVGAFLSGGLDSSTVTALMTRHSTGPVRTFSVGFGKAIDELPYARRVARMYGTDHHEVDFGEPEVGPLLERMAEVYDEPFADTSNIPTFLLSEFARRHVKVVLTGDGGDELFGGYWWHPPLSRSVGMRASRASWFAWRILSRALRDRDPSLRARSVAAGLAAASPDPMRRNVRIQTWLKAPVRAGLWGGAGPAPYEPGAYYEPPEGVAGMNRAFWFDLVSYLPGDILVKVDRAAMAVGLETRAPFLDRELAEFAMSLPDALKVDGRTGATKIVLKAACAKYWPPELRTRAKQGFGAPCGAWLARPDVRSLVDRVFAQGSPLRALLPGLRPGSFQAPDIRKWTLLVLGIWLERNREAM